MRPNSYVVLCPTYDAAVSEWMQVRASYPIWVKSSRRPLMLISYDAIYYTFHSENAGNRLRGLKGKFISPEELHDHLSQYEI